MLQQIEPNTAVRLSAENASPPNKLTLLDFAEVFLALPETDKREVLGYAKCLYASATTSGGNSAP